MDFLGQIACDIACGVGDVIADSRLAPCAHTVDIESDLLSRNGAVLSDYAAFVIGVRSLTGRPAWHAVERLRALVPHAGIFVCSSSYSEMTAQFALLAKSGADSVCILNDEQAKRDLQYSLWRRLV